MTSNRFRLILLLILAFPVFSCLSCSRVDRGKDNRLPVFPVSGKVLISGQPAENALLVFHPTAGQEQNAVRPTGRTDAEGNFSLTTYESGDGAPAGEYVVTVLWPEPPMSPMADPDLAPDRLLGQYANPRASLLRARILEQENVVAPFQLTK